MLYSATLYLNEIKDVSASHRKPTRKEFRPPQSLNSLSISHGSINKDIMDRVTLSVTDMVVTAESIKMTNLGAKAVTEY